MSPELEEVLAEFKKQAPHEYEHCLKQLSVLMLVAEVRNLSNDLRLLKDTVDERLAAIQSNTARDQR